MLADEVTVKPLLIDTDCEARGCDAHADFAVAEISFDGEDVGTNGVDTSHYCAGCTPEQVALRLR